MAWLYNNMIGVLALLIWEAIIAVHGSFTTVEVTVGRTALLPCTVDFSGSPMVMWLDPSESPLTRNEQTVTDDERFTVDRPYNNEWNLQIEDVRGTDEGNYTCLINATPIQKKIVLLRIVSAPTIVSSSPDMEEEAGNDVTLECEATGTPQPVISWYKYSFKGEKHDLAVTGSQLMLPNVSRHDAARYQCEAVNGILPHASMSIRLDIKFAPIVTLPHQYLSQEPGRDTFMQCTINAHPHEESYWVKDGVIVEDTDKYDITKQDTERYNMSLFLFIHDLQEDDFGKYNCVASNSFGTDSGVVELFEWQSGQARVIIPPEDKISRQSSDIRINCTVDNMGQKDNLIWWHNHPTKGPQKIFESHPSSDTETPRITLNTAKYEILGHYDLVVKNISFGDSGEYMCELSQKKNHTASVTVVDELICNNNYENKTHMPEGELMALSCSMTYAGPSRQWQTVWRHDDVKMSTINEDTAVSIRRTISFPVFAKDSGAYACFLTSSSPAFNSHCDIDVNVVAKEKDDDDGGGGSPPPGPPAYSILPSITPADPTPSPTSAPFCQSDPWSIATSSLAIIVASCVGGTALVFVVILLCVRSHYHKKLCAQKKIIPVTPNVYESNNHGNHGNGGVNSEATRLTCDVAEDEV